MNFKKMLINFRQKGYSGIIPFMYVGKEEIPKYVQHKVSMTVTRPQFQDVLSQLIFTMTQCYSHNASHMHRGSLHPHFKM